MNQTIKLDAKKREGSFCKERIYPLRRGERNNVTLTVAVRRDRRPYDLAGMTAHLVWQAADGKLVGPVPMEVADQAAGTVRCTLPNACYAAVGTARAYIEIRNGAELVDTTDEMSIEVLDCIDADAEQAEEYKPLIAEVREATDAAKSAAERAESGEDECAAAERARVSAEESREQAEQARKQAESTRASSETLRALSETSRAEAESLRKQAESLRGESETKREEAFAKSVEKANAANDAAANAATDAQAAIAEVKATEAKLYPAAENILVGSETGTVAHVEDAFDGATLRKITVEGACKQDGMPTPDNPVPIVVVENPVVKVVGRNLANPSQAYYFAADGKPKAEQIADGFRFVVTNNSTRLLAVPCELKKGDTIVVNFDTKQLSGNTQRIQIYFPVTSEYVQIGKPHVMAADVVFIGIYIEAGTVGEYDVTNFRISRNVDDGYKPYTSQTLTFTLPAEHPYLAKLPDGTADEIVVDEEGNVELVARVARVLPSEQKIVFVQGGDDFASYVSLTFANDSESQKRLMSSAYEAAEWTTKSGYIYCPQKTSIVIRDNRFTSEAQARELLNGVVVYIAVEPTRYPLGKIEMPKAQDSIVNAWTDAEVTPNTGIGYVRDVNIVIANLESAIASITEG